jgi:NAD(P)H-dependent FMN reductase
MTNILVLVGSLRAGSVNRQIADVAVEAATAGGVGATVYERLGDVPFYNEDLDTADAPPAVTELRAATTQADAVLVVTPEYNGTIPGVLKNAIDWLSRPYGASALQGKPLAVIGSALGQYGGVWAHDDTRKSFGIAGARVVEDITLSVPTKTFDGAHPSENAELVGNVRETVAKLNKLVSNA